MFAIFQQSRFAPYFEKVKDVINSGILGRIVQISINLTASPEGGTGNVVRNSLPAASITQAHTLWIKPNLLDYYDGMPWVFAKWIGPTPSGMQRTM